MLVSPAVIEQDCWYHQPPTLLRPSGVLPPLRSAHGVRSPQAAARSPRPRASITACCEVSGSEPLVLRCCSQLSPLAASFAASVANLARSRFLLSPTPIPPSFLRSTSPGRCAYRGKIPSPSYRTVAAISAKGLLRLFSKVTWPKSDVPLNFSMRALMPPWGEM